MNKTHNIIRFIFFLFFLWAFHFSAIASEQDSIVIDNGPVALYHDSLLASWGHLGTFIIDSTLLDTDKQVARFYYHKTLAYLPWRVPNVESFKQSLLLTLGDQLQDYKLEVYAGALELDQLIPNVFNDDNDASRLAKPSKKPPYIHKLDGMSFDGGLKQNNIALWHSHGWYYEADLDRWEWQRARLFSTVEDIFPMTFMLPYLAPMLENAGATLFMPRERCFQKSEVIVDNDMSTTHSEFSVSKGVATVEAIGFINCDTLFTGDNPFKMGTSLLVTNAQGQVAKYTPKIEEAGQYAVYVSYQQLEGNSEKVKYTIHHSGGVSAFEVNQTMGGGTWAYLGLFHFNKGTDASVGVSGNGQISLDAIRFGGGMGTIARRFNEEDAPIKEESRNEKRKKKKEPKEEVTQEEVIEYKWKTSQRPRYMEAARYWMQYAGMPDTLVYSLNGELDDYKDDYQSRGEWVNYLMGASKGTRADTEAQGLNLPIDLAFAFHTDAGITPHDSTIGTLGIYSTENDDGVFINGQSRLSSRDLTDVIQTQVVDDIRALYNKEWTRRAMWDKQYSEAWRPQVPTMLLELLSHQNIADMQLGLDPHFRFDVSRSVYKGILQYLAYQEQRDYVVQPLPVNHLAITELKKGYVLSWKPVLDSLEVSAVPTKYKVYQRIGLNGFDNGTVVEGTRYNLPKVTKGQLLSYKVTAINDGGESFPSEVLSLGVVSKKAEKVLVVNAFDRISAPAFIDEGNFAGVASWDDLGVPDKYEYGYTGEQYDYNRQSPWLDDDSPGWGASYGNDEMKIVKGNSFDNTIIHGQAMMMAGYSFISISDEVFEGPEYDASAYQVVDIIFGEEKTTSSYQGKAPNYKIYTPALMEKLRVLTSNQQNLFISGAYVGSDIKQTVDAKAFVADILKFKWRSNHAAKVGDVYVTDKASSIFKGRLHFNTSFHPQIYTVEAPDAIEPVGAKSHTAFRYRENNASAATLYKGDYKVLTLGFPFETLVDEGQRNQLMSEILDLFFKTK